MLVYKHTDCIFAIYRPVEILFLEFISTRTGRTCLRTKRTSLSKMSLRPEQPGDKMTSLVC